MISPSILNSDFLNLGATIDMLNESEAELIHLDIMDGVFVPNLSFGMPIIAQINKRAKKPLDVHLMITKPERYIERFIEAGADYLTIHYEATEDVESCLKKIRDLGTKAAISLKPATDVSVLEPYLDLLDMVLIMSVEPGYGGQSFQESSFDRVRKLKQMITASDNNILIEIDGGVSTSNIQALREAGVDVFVVGTAVFRADDPKEMIKSLNTPPNN